MKQRTLFPFLILFISVMLSGCFSLLTGAPKSQTQYVLTSEGCESPAVAPLIGPSLLITTPKASAFMYSTRIIFSRDEQTRGLYQYAFWTEPPPDRIAVILESELRCRGRYSKISRNAFPADKIVRFELIDFRHDISTNPGEVIVEMGIEILDGKTGALIDKHQHTERLAAPSYDAAGAVTALNQGTRLMVRHMADWLLKK